MTLGKLLTSSYLCCEHAAYGSGRSDWQISDNRAVHPVEILKWFLILVECLLAAGWVWQALQWLVHSGDLRDLTQPRLALPDTGGPAEEPELCLQMTVVVPACNEETSIGATLNSLLKSEGIRLQIIAVNDRSTDGTGAVMDEVARVALSDAVARERLDAGRVADSAGALKIVHRVDLVDRVHGVERVDHPLEILHIEELPPGWLGKPHALATAASRAEADWILFTDGDVVFAPEALARALEHAEREQTDHLVLMPTWTLGQPGEFVMQGAMHALSSWSLHLWRVADPKARDFLGVGAFNLIRRKTYEALGGFESLRMEVLEDVRFGWKLKKAGYRQEVVIGPGLASVRWAEGAWGVVKNLEKNVFALYRYRAATAWVACLGLVIQIVLPIIGLVVGGLARIAALVLYGAVAVIYVSSTKVTRVPPIYVLLFPLGIVLFLVAHLRSILLTLGRGGVRWRGTLYSLKELRAAAGDFW